MKNINKKVLFLILLLMSEIIFFNISNSEIWLSIRGPILTGLIISLAIIFPELNFHKIKNFFIRKI